MSETKHSPTPWKVEEKEHGRTQRVISVDRSGVIAELRNYGQSGDNLPAVCFLDELRANAAYIVRAANCHEELVASLRGLLEVLKAGEFDTTAGTCAVVRAYSCLDRAEGK